MAVPPTASATRRAGSSSSSNDGCTVTASMPRLARHSGGRGRHASAPRCAFRGLTLVGNVARKHDGTDDVIAIVADRRRLQIDDAVVAAAGVEYEVVGFDDVAAKRTDRRQIALFQRTSIDVTVTILP